MAYTTGAHGLVERASTKRRLESLAGGRVWQGTVDDDDIIQRFPDAKTKPYIVVQFGAPIRTTRERNLTNGDLGQPHIQTATVSCVAGDYDSAQQLMGAVVETLVDWAPSDFSDPWRLEGGFGNRRARTSNTPTRFIEGLFLTTTINLGVDAHAI